MCIRDRHQTVQEMLHFNAFRVGNGSEVHFFIVFHQKLRILDVYKRQQQNIVKGQTFLAEFLSEVGIEHILVSPPVSQFFPVCG